MGLTNSSGLVSFIAGVAVVVGVFGVVIPMLPGLLVTWAGVLVWALFGGAGRGRWVVLGVATAVLAVGLVAKYMLPGRNLKRAGVPNLTLFLGGLLGLVGFFVVPVIGLVLGFVLGVFLVELARQHDAAPAWQSTKHALKAAGVSMLIELAAALTIAGIWVAGLLLT